MPEPDADDLAALADGDEVPVEPLEPELQAEGSHVGEAAGHDDGG